MQYALALTALAVSVFAAPDELFNRSPNTTSECADTYPGTFAFTTERLPGERNLAEEDTGPSKHKRQAAVSSNVVCSRVVLTLNDGNLVDQSGWTGSVVANDQIQFDGTFGPQPDSKVTTGWNVCGDGKINLGSQDVFFNCYNQRTETAAGFYNLYAAPLGDSNQCEQVNFIIQPCCDVNGTAQTQQLGRDDITTLTSSASGSSSTCGAVPSLSGASSAASSTSSASQVPMSSVMEMMSEMYPATTATTPVATPAPASNATSAASGTGNGASPTGPTAVPSPFTGSGSMLAVCKGFVVMVAGAAAFALF